MENGELEEIRKAVKELTDGLRKMGREMVDDSIPKAERFLTWVMYDQLIFQSNVKIQNFLSEMEET